MYVLIHQIFEPDFSLDIPIVEHAFYGNTPEETEEVYKVHSRFDSFLNSCDNYGRFGKSTVCKTNVIGPLKVNDER